MKSLNASRRFRLAVEALESRDLPSGLAVDWALPDGGGEFRLTLQNQQLTLAQIGGTELYQTSAQDIMVNINGTSAAELIHVDFDQANSSTGLSLQLQTKGGGDTVLINLSSLAETVDLAPQAALVHAPNYDMQVLGAETMRVFGNGGVDTLHMADGPGEDVVNASLNDVTMTRAGTFLNEAQGFQSVKITATATESNRATLTGSGITAAEMNGNYVRMRYYQGPVVGYNLLGTIELTGFRNVLLEGRPGYGNEVLTVTDSILSDILTFEPNYGVLQRGDAIVHSFRGFDRITFQANSGKSADRDTVKLFDSAGMETFQAAGTTGTYRDGKNQFELYIMNADVIYLDGRKGGRNILVTQTYSFQLKASGFYSANVYTFGQTLTRAQALYWIKQVALQLDPHLGTAPDRFRLALWLMDFVHQRVNIAATSAAWAAQDPYARFVQAIVTRQASVLCQGIAWLYRDLLEAFGISAREVSLFAANGATHASVEVFLSGHWFVMDPSYRAMFVDTRGNFLSYQQMKTLGSWQIVHDDVPNRLWLAFDRGTYALYLNRLQYPLFVDGVPIKTTTPTTPVAPAVPVKAPTPTSPVLSGLPVKANAWS